MKSVFLASARTIRRYSKIAAFLLASFFALNISSAVYADATTGIITDKNDVRWEYILDGDLTIKFYDKPAAATTVKVPSLSELISLVPGAPSTLDTYFLKSARADLQDAAFPDVERRVATADTTKLDMTDTSKIQILGVKPIINPAVETELVFGENMVLGDEPGKVIDAEVCKSPKKDTWNGAYTCDYDYWVQVHYLIPDYDIMTDEEKATYVPSASKIGCWDLGNNVTDLNFDKNKCYVGSVSAISSVHWYANSKSGSYDTRAGGVFSGYKLKLTNFSGDNFNYVGWHTFANSTFADTTITISGNAFLGENIFMNTNIEKAIINTEKVGSGLFRDCSKLTKFEYADDVTVIAEDTFAGTGLTTVDLSGTNIKTIGARAFEGAKVTNVKLDGVQRINYKAFSNNDVKELTLPKSINYLQALLFSGNKHMKKLTIAYDTLTSGTTLPMFAVLDNRYSLTPGEETPTQTIEEVNIIAPYADDEEVSSTHVTYNQYKWNFNAYDQRYMPECPNQHGVKRNVNCNGNSAASNDYGETQYGAYVHNYYELTDKQNYRGSGSDFEDEYAHVDTYKNVLAPIYFHYMPNIRKITIGEGYEFIGAMAFYNYKGTGLGSGKTLFEGKGVEQTGFALNLPDSLRGVGNGAFFGQFQDSIDFTIPRNIEFIGINAFMDTFFYDKDVDFPNLVALGDHAFEKTRVKNIHLYDKLKYMGMEVFSDCLFIKDITFDLDVFNPDINMAWALPHRGGGMWYDSQFHMTQHFGPRHPYGFSQAEIEKYGLNVQDRSAYDSYNYWPLKFGTITFTEKNISQLPNGFNNCYYGRTSYGGSSSNWIDNVEVGNTYCPGGSYGSGIYNTFFGHMNAEKFDIGETNWKVLSPRMFSNTSSNEVILPKGLEVIPGDSFADSYIGKELTLPNTLKVVGDAAFDNGRIYKAEVWNPTTWTYEKTYDWLEKYSIKIKNLPKSLEYIGNDAFWGDYNLTTDVDLPNLKYVGYHAFWGTRVRDVYLPPSIEVLGGAAFANITTLRDITIDFDFGALPPNKMTFSPEYFPQSARDFAGANLFQYITMSCSATGMADSKSYPVTNFYSIFNQGNVDDVKDGNRIIEYGQNKAHTHFGKVTFTENAKTDIFMYNSSEYEPKYYGAGYFAGLEFDELDLGASGLKSITKLPFAFNDVKIGKLTLPAGLETIENSSFVRAEIGDSFTIPASVTSIGANAFMEAKLGGDVTIEDGSKKLTFATNYGTSNTFLRTTIDGTVTVPGRVNGLIGQNFMEAKLGGLKLGNGIETIGMNVFLRATINDPVVIPSSVKSIQENGFMEAKLGGLTLNNGIQSFGKCSFIRAEIDGEFSFPSTVKEIGEGAFMYAKMHTQDSFKEGLETVGAGAFIHTNFADELVIPSTVKQIGWSAFNAGEADVHYKTVTIKPDLTIASASNQRVHQLLWNASVDKLIIDSSKLVAMDQGIEGRVSERDNGEEFWNMTMKEVVINNLQKITYAAFNKCNKLEIVDMSKNAKIREIDDQAFMDDSALHVIKFSPSIKNMDVVLGESAFANTGFTTIGREGTDFDLTAANFDATGGATFSRMAKLKSVDIPSNFSYAKIPEKTFADSTELEEATVDYKIKLIDNAAFSNDNKLKRIFIWGNTTILDENLPGYVAPINGMGADGDEEPEEEVYGPTIPEGTDIYAYSSWNAEPYAGSSSRENFEGTFYPLDEVLYITTNKTHVKVNDENTDFDKTGMIVYGMRRDGIVLESDHWSEYDGVAYTRSSKDLNFAKMAPTITENPDFGTVWDTPVPLAELSLANENFANIDFELIDDAEGVAGVKLVNIIYTDKYTENEPDTDVLPLTDGGWIVPIPTIPVTLDNIMGYIAIMIGAFGVIVALLIVSRKMTRRR